MRVAWPSTAFVDEARTDQLYLLAAVVVEDRNHDSVRQHMLALRIGSTKLHWTKEGDQRRAMIAAMIASLSLRHLVVVSMIEPGEPDERARRKCLRRLLWELDRMDVERVVFEARSPAQNGLDRRLVELLRRSRELRARLRAEHRAGPGEPLLWLADAVAGAMRAQRLGVANYIELAERVSVIEL